MNKYLTIALVLILAICLILYFNSNIYYASKLVKAIKEYDIETVKEIIAEKPDSVNTYPSLLPRGLNNLLDARYMSPLIQACAVGDIEIVSILIEAGADINLNDGFTPLFATYFYKKGDWYDISKYLIEEGASLNYVTDLSGGYSTILNDIVFLRRSEKMTSFNSEIASIVSSFEYALEHCDPQMINWKFVFRDVYWM